jgi:hypothetical protein
MLNDARAKAARASDGKVIRGQIIMPHEPGPTIRLDAANFAISEALRALDVYDHITSLTLSACPGWH